MSLLARGTGSRNGLLLDIYRQGGDNSKERLLRYGTEQEKGGSGVGLLLAQLLQPLAVAGGGGMGGKVKAQEVEHAAVKAIVLAADGIVHPDSAASVVNPAGVLEIVQVAGNRLLLELQGRHQVGDAQLSLGEQQ